MAVLCAMLQVKRMLLKFGSEIVALCLVSLLLFAAADPASAVSGEVARRCSALMVKQFPPRELGNPAAGSAKGTGRDQQAFFNKCVANGGKVNDDSGK